MEREVQEIVGKWVAVAYSYTVTGIFTAGAGMHFAYGVLESADDAALLVRQADGETLYIPTANARGVRMIEPPEMGPGGTLLRPSNSESLEEALVRPAQSSM